MYYVFYYGWLSEWRKLKEKTETIDICELNSIVNDTLEMAFDYNTMWFHMD